MADVIFGETISPDNGIRNTLSKAPALPPSDVALLLRECYDTTYGIYNHDAPTEDRPLALLAMHPMENNLHGSLLYERLDQFVDYDVYRYTGLSWDKFMEQPHYMCERILEQCLKRKNARDKNLSDMGREFEEGLGDKG